MAGHQGLAVLGDGGMAGQAAVHVEDIGIALALRRGVHCGIGPETVDLERAAQGGDDGAVDLLQFIHDGVVLGLGEAAGRSVSAHPQCSHGDAHAVGGQEARADRAAGAGGDEKAAQQGDAGKTDNAAVQHAGPPGVLLGSDPARRRAI